MGLWQWFDDNVIDRVENAIGGELAVLHNKLEDYNGYEEFKNFMQQEGPVQEHLREIAGGLDAPEQQKAFLERMNTLAEQDPEIFKKLNDITKADGFDSFLEKVEGNEALSAVFKDMLSDTSAEPGTSLKILNGIHGQLTKNPEFFNTVTKVMDEHPNMVNTIANELRDNPDGAMAMIDGFMQQKDFIDKISGLFDNFSLEGGLEGLMQIMLTLVTGVNAMTEQLASGLGNFFSQGNFGLNAAGPTPDGARRPDAPAGPNPEEERGAAPASPAPSS